MQIQHRVYSLPTNVFRRGIDSLRIGQNRQIRQYHSLSNPREVNNHRRISKSVLKYTKIDQQQKVVCFSRALSTNEIHKKSMGQESSQAGEQEHFPSDRGMNTRLSAENDYLSWMRNSYIMTLGGVSMLHFDLWSAGPVAGAAALLTASLNLMWGTMGYLHNLQCLRRRNYISAVMCRLAQLWALLHFTLWVMVLLVIFPDYKLIEASDLTQKYNDEEES